jgi:hypothetical protein
MPTATPSLPLPFEVFMTSRLSPEDQQRVDQYLSAPQHQVERKPFKVWLLLTVIVIAVIGMGLLSRLLSQLVL